MLDQVAERTSLSELPPLLLYCRRCVVKNHVLSCPLPQKGETGIGAFNSHLRYPCQRSVLDRLGHRVKSGKLVCTNLVQDKTLTTVAWYPAKPGNSQVARKKRNEKKKTPLERRVINCDDNRRLAKRDMIVPVCPASLSLGAGCRK